MGFVVPDRAAQPIEIPFPFGAKVLHGFNQIFFSAFRPEVRDAVVAVIVDDLIGKGPDQRDKLLPLSVFHPVIHNIAAFQCDFDDEGIEQTKFRTLSFGLLRRGAVEPRKGFGEAFRGFIAVFISGIEHGNVRILKLLSGQGETPLPDIFHSRHTHDKAEGAVKIVVGHVYALCHVSILDRFADMLLHIANCLLDMLD